MASNTSQHSYKPKLARTMGSSKKMAGFMPDCNLKGSEQVTNKKV